MGAHTSVGSHLPCVPARYWEPVSEWVSQHLCVVGNLCLHFMDVNAEAQRGK